MINFRFHIVSIAAILIALAAGIALGSGPLDDTGDSLRGDTTSQKADPALAGFEAGFADQVAPDMVEDELKGESVLLITVPGTSPAQVKSIAANLELAGAETSGQIALTSKLLDSSGRQFAEGVAEQSAADVESVASATGSYERIGAALGRALMADKAEALDSTATTIRSAFTEGDLIVQTTAPKRAATVAVLVAGPQTSAGASDRSTVAAALAAALNTSGRGVVVAGPSTSSTDGGVVKAVRDGDAGADISTVDVTDSAAGRVVTVLATVAQVAGKPGAWGTSRSAGGALPN